MGFRTSVDQVEGESYGNCRYIFGSDTGNTEHIAKMIQKELGKHLFDVMDIAKSTKEQIASYDLLLFGIPTWYYGEAQCDWDDFFPELENIDFNNKLVAIFGCGDQEDYAEYFLDAMGTLRDIIEPKGAIIVGNWPTKGYNFVASKALADNDHFVGLGIDEDRQPELTEQRVKQWCKQIYDELSLKSWKVCNLPGVRAEALTLLFY